jgi:hypothetical protein
MASPLAIAKSRKVALRNGVATVVVILVAAAGVLTMATTIQTLKDNNSVQRKTIERLETELRLKEVQMVSKTGSMPHLLDEKGGTSSRSTTMRHLLGSSRIENRLLRAKGANSGGKLGLVKRTKIAWVTLATGKTWAKQAVHWMHSSQSRFCAGSKSEVYDVYHMVMTDPPSYQEFVDSAKDVDRLFVWTGVKKLGWPQDTLNKFQVRCAK